MSSYIEIKDWLIERLEHLKKVPRHTFDDVIEYLLDFYEKHKEEVR